MTEQEQLEKIRDDAPTPAEAMLEPLPIDEHRDELNQAFSVLFSWIQEARTPAGLAARFSVLAGALQAGEFQSAKAISEHTGCSRAYVTQLIEQVQTRFGIVHPSRRTKGRG